MMDFFNKFLSRDPETEEITFDQEDQIERQVAVLFSVLSTIVGAEQVILRAGKLGCLELIRSERLEDRILALQKLVFQDPTHDRTPDPADIPALLADIEEELADMMARKTVEDKIEKKVVERMEERHQEYVSEIRQQILKEEEKTAENPQTIKKLEKLEALEKKSLTRALPELLRPQSLEEIIGQERAVEAIKAKLASVYPQHLLLYGPPGVGKTTAARLVLQAARELKHTPFAEDAPFVEVDGTTLRWDPRDITNPLIGSVHDPIYQGARRDLAETGIPEPKPGLVTDAHGGILFIDEIGEMDPMLQNKLLKVMEDKRVSFDSTYYDTSDPSVPNYIRRLFEHGAPADFILIGATTRAPHEINPAFRSRCAEIFFESLTPSHIQSIIKSAMEKLHAEAEAKVAEIISEYTIEGRKAINLLADAYSGALYRANGADDNIVITEDDIYRVIQASRLSAYVTQKGSDKPEVGRVFGLGVAGYLGSVIEIEAVVFPAKESGKGRIRFNETAGSMAKDSVFNASSVVRQMTGKDLADYDVHINIIGGGQIDGPSAGVAILAAILSALTGKPVRQDMAVTGEISIQGRVKAVGGVVEKAYGAKQAGITSMILPKENEKDIPAAHLGLNIHPVATAEEAIRLLIGDITD